MPVIAASYLGTDPEPRAGLSSGHIPHSFSLPFDVFLQKDITPDDTEYTCLLPQPALQKALADAVGSVNADAIIKGNASVVTTCGSGMTAGVLWLGLRLLGVENVGLYDEVSLGFAREAPCTDP